MSKCVCRRRACVLLIRIRGRCADVFHRNNSLSLSVLGLYCRVTCYPDPEGGLPWCLRSHCIFIHEMQGKELPDLIRVTHPFTFRRHVCTRGDAGGDGLKKTVEKRFFFLLRVQDIWASGYSEGQMKTIYFVDGKNGSYLFYFVPLRCRRFNDNIKFLLNFYHVCFYYPKRNWWRIRFVLLIKKMHFPSFRRNKIVVGMINLPPPLTRSIYIYECVWLSNEIKPRRRVPEETFVTRIRAYVEAKKTNHPRPFPSLVNLWYWRLSYGP